MLTRVTEGGCAEEKTKWVLFLRNLSLVWQSDKLVRFCIRGGEGTVLGSLPGSVAAFPGEHLPESLCFFLSLQFFLS